MAKQTQPKKAAAAPEAPHTTYERPGEAMKRVKSYWIKERDNPQLGIYYVGCGQMSKTRAKRMEGRGYGTNTMHPFDTETAYKTRLKELREQGETVHEDY